jgi:hypothetical protein
MRRKKLKIKEYKNRIVGIWRIARLIKKDVGTLSHPAGEWAKD